MNANTQNGFISVRNLSEIKEAPEGFRIARVIAKKGKIGERECKSQGAVLKSLSRSKIDWFLNSEVGEQFFRNALEQVQDSLLRAQVENGKLSVHESAIDAESILQAITVAVESARFSKDSIEKWFVEHMQEVLTTQITAKYDGISDDKLSAMLKNYLVSFQILAGRNPSMADSTKAGLIRAMEFLDENSEEHPTTVEIARRLVEVSAPTEMLEML